MVKNAEEFMYRLMASLYSVNAPIVFKGAMLLKVIQNKYGNPSGLVRETHDLDGDWVSGEPDMSYLTGVLQKATINAGYDVVVKPYRCYSKGKSAGFEFIDVSSNKQIITMDLSIRKNNYSCIYTLIDGVYFYGQTVDKIIADKVYTCSKRVVMRRVKDVIDLYILSFIWRGKYSYISCLLESLSREVEDFDRFLHYYKDLEHAYSKYKNKASILPFDVVYKRVCIFLKPFYERTKIDLFWDGNKWR